MKKMVKTMLLVMTLIMFLMSCSKGNESSKSEQKGKELAISTSKGDVEVAKNPKKVVVFDYGILDIMDNLGVSVDLAIPSSNIPSTLAKYKEGTVDAGALHEPNFEKINEFAPDLIIITARQEKHYDELSKIAPTIYMAPEADNYISSVLNNIETIGKIFGKENEAKEKTSEITKEIEEIKGLVANLDKKVLLTLTNDGKISAYGKGSRFGFVFSDLGLKSVDEEIKASTHGQEINYEYISEKNPDIIFYVDRTKIVGGSKEGSDVFKNPLVENTNAGKNNKIIPLNPETWYIVAGGIASTKAQLNEIKDGIK